METLLLITGLWLLFAAGTAWLHHRYCEWRDRTDPYDWSEDGFEEAT